MLSWDGGSENKALLRKAYSNPAKDIGLYVKDDLFGENLLEENYAAFEFLQSQIDNLENVNDTTIVLRKIETLIEELKFLQPNQVEIAEKLKKVVNSYKKILSTIKN